MKRRPAPNAGFQLTNEFLALMLDPFVNGRGNVGGGRAARRGLCAGQQNNLPADVALAYASISTRRRRRIMSSAGPPGARLLAAATAPTAIRQSDQNQTASTLVCRRHGLSFHARHGGGLCAGAGANWGLANALGGGHSDALQAGAYGISWFGPAYVAGAVSFSNHWFTTGRAALGDQLNASFIGQSYGARLEGGYRYAVLPTFAVTPYGAVQFQDFHTPAYSETDVTGGGFGLSYAAMNATEVRTELGSRFDAPTVLYGKPLVLYGRVAWAHDFAQTPRWARHSKRCRAPPSPSSARRSRTTRR